MPAPRLRRCVVRCVLLLAIRAYIYIRAVLAPLNNVCSLRDTGREVIAHPAALKRGF